MSVLVENKPPALSLSRTHPGRLLDLAAVGVPALLALILCLYDLGSRSLWLDEAATISIASQHGAAFGSALAHDGGNMLGYYALLHVLIGAFGNGAVLVRLPSALAAGATIALTSTIALRLWDRRVAVVSGVLGAVSLPLVYWGQDARGYMLMIALVCASFLLLVLALQRPRPGWGLWLGYVAVTVGAVYMGLEATLVFPAQLIVLLWHRRHAAWLLSGLFVSAICCLPLAILALSRGSAQIFWIPRPNAFTTRQVLLTLTSGGLEPQFYSASGDATRALTEVLLVFAVGAIAWLLWRARTRGQAWRPVLVAGWLFVPAVLSWVISELGHSMFEARYLLMSLPAVALLLAWLIVGLATAGGTEAGDDALAQAGRTQRWHLPKGTGRAVRIVSRVVAAVLLVGLITLRALQLAPSYGVSTEPWRAVTNHVLASSRPGDCIAFYPLDSRMPFRYYLPPNSQPPEAVLPNVGWSNSTPFVEAYSTLPASRLSRLPTHCRRVWLVSSHQGRNTGTALGHAHYVRYEDLVAGLNSHYLNSGSSTFGAARIITLQLFSDPRTKRGRGSGPAFF